MNYLNGIYVQKAIQLHSPEFIQNELEKYMQENGNLIEIAKDTEGYTNYLIGIMLEKFECLN